VRSLDLSNVINLVFLHGLRVVLPAPLPLDILKSDISVSKQAYY
jgi:hypothetical protein